MRTADYDFQLPPELIAQRPAPERDQSRLLVLERGSGRIEHREFRSLAQYLRGGDILVLNDSRVIPARFRGVNCQTGGQFEILLLEENALNDWWVMLRPAKRARLGTEISLWDRRGQPSGAQATVVGKNEEGHRRLRFAGVTNLGARLEDWGEMPLPPYINRPKNRRAEEVHHARLTHPQAAISAASEDGQRAAGEQPVESLRVAEEDRQRYQTVYARVDGSVAAPTAGLHFTAALLEILRARGIQICFLTLHVGLGTFAPVKAETMTGHKMHAERYALSEGTARVINEGKRAGRRVIAVGTTTLRVLESVAARNEGRLVAGAGRTRVFIYPPWNFRVADALVTNFHLPRSTLLMLASAFTAPNETGGRELLLSAYAAAVRERYRFFSYGDAMLIL